MCAKAISPWLLPFSKMTIFLPLHTMSKLFSIAWVLVLYSKTLINAYCWFGCRSLSFISKKRSYIAFLAANFMAIYLALVDNSITVDYFFEHQLIDLSFNIKTKPDIDFWLSLFFTQSESKYFLTKCLFWPPYVILQSFKLFR